LTSQAKAPSAQGATVSSTVTVGISKVGEIDVRNRRLQTEGERGNHGVKVLAAVTAGVSV